ncbi:YraN family protein [Clostridium sp. Cult1]|jgi:putative endonuclease|uniref:YraN family protein n=1 Tax=Clostridium sp. Cult1 TaxID=2079002 RepID=UPI001F0152EB|nr:YraN family protein [Clostridium sp. Cult1]MCF6463352.1 YraN family protein [Clostridium sp. Cult1]
MKNNISKGILGENEAVEYLISKGYRVVDRNYRTKVGEIDIIAIKFNILVFVEVKTRTSIKYGYPYESVNWRKQQKIYKSSLIYMNHKKMNNYQIRYDIIEVFLEEKPKINHIENAFCI